MSTSESKQRVPVIHICMPKTATKTLLDNDLKHAREKNLLPVWSWESYSTDILAQRRVRALNLKKVFGDCKKIYLEAPSLLSGR